MEQQKTHGKSFFGLVLILFGVLILLENLNLIDGRLAEIIFSVPMFLILIGIMIFLNSNRRGFALVVASIGVLLLIPEFYPSVELDFGMIVAIFFIIAGANVFFRHKKIESKFRERFFSKHEEMVNQDLLDEIAIFGGGEKKIVNDNFKGGRITTVFGGNEIDLTDCKLTEGTSVIDVFTMFGGVELHVPSNWKIKHDVIPIFGGFSQAGRKSRPEEISDTSTLFIKGIVIFGGVEVKSV